MIMRAYQIKKIMMKNEITRSTITNIFPPELALTAGADVALALTVGVGVGAAVGVVMAAGALNINE